jgi:amidase
MKAKGAEIIDEVTFEHRQKWGAAEWQVLLYEFKADLNKYLAKASECTGKNLEELIEFNKRNAEKEMPWFGQEIFEMAQEKGDLTAKNT